MFSSKCKTFDLQVSYITPSFAGHSCVILGEMLYYLPIHCYALWFLFNVKYICNYNS